MRGREEREEEGRWRQKAREREQGERIADRLQVLRSTTLHVVVYKNKPPSHS